MPNVIGQILDCARDTLKAAGVYNPKLVGYLGTDPVSISWKHIQQPQNAQLGIVLAQSPTWGTVVTLNTPIVLQASNLAVGVAESPTAAGFVPATGTGGPFLTTESGLILETEAGTPLTP